MGTTPKLMWTIMASILLVAVDATVLYVFNPLGNFNDATQTGTPVIHACEVGGARCRNITLASSMTSDCRCAAGMTIGTNGQLHVASGCGHAPCWVDHDNRICAAPTDGSGTCDVTNTGFKELAGKGAGAAIASDGDEVWVLDRVGYPDGPGTVNLCPSAGSWSGCKSIDADWYRSWTSPGGYHALPWVVKVHKNETFIVHAAGPNGEQDEPWGIRACTKEGACREVGNWSGLKFMDDFVIANDTIFALYNKATYRWEGNYSVRACHIISNECWELGGSFKGRTINSAGPSIAASEDRIFIGEYIDLKLPHEIPRGSLSSSRLDGGGWETVNLGLTWPTWVNAFDIVVSGDSLYAAIVFNNTDSRFGPIDAKVLKCAVSGGDCKDTGLPPYVLPSAGFFEGNVDEQLHVCEYCTLKDISQLSLASFV